MVVRTVTNTTGQPLMDNSPFKGGRIIFAKRKTASGNPSSTAAEATASPPPADLAAHNLLEQSISARFGPATAQQPDGQGARSENNYLGNNMEITEYDAIKIVLTSKYINLIYDGKELERLMDFLDEFPDCPLEKLPDEYVDVMSNEVCGSDNFISFELLSDDIDNDYSAGPWPIDLYGFAGVWVFWSPDYDRAYFIDRESAIEHCYEHAHERIISRKTFPIEPWQELQDF